MDTKLTLKLDQNIIILAKEYAENNHKSLSKLVEDYFSNLVYANKQPKKYPPLIENLSGVVSENDLERISGEDEKAGYILRKDR